MNATSNGYLDLRDIIEELDNLEEMFSADGMSDEDIERRNDLRTFEHEFETSTGYELRSMADNEPNAIAESEFEDYCQELAEDCGYVAHTDQNPLLNYIDWERWAKDCRYDYTEFEFEDVTYLVRSY